MSSRRIDVILTSCACWVGPRQLCKKLSDFENEIYRVQLGVFVTKFGHKSLLSLSAQPDLCERTGKNNC